MATVSNEVGPRGEVDRGLLEGPASEIVKYVTAFVVNLPRPGLQMDKQYGYLESQRH